jgi:uracil-DNA glycosylase
MSQPFDPGPVAEAFASPARNYPGTDPDAPSRFQVEGGPIFHGGGLDGSARILVLGQDPAGTSRSFTAPWSARPAQRVQGFLWKLGVERSYVMVQRLPLFRL